MLSAEEWDALRLSVIVAFASVVISLPFGVPLGYLLARKDFKGKAIVEMLVNFSLVLPPVVVGYALLILLGRKGFIGNWLWETFGISVAFTLFAAVLAAAVVSFPLMVRSIRLAFQEVDPKLEQAARTLGASKWRAFWSISLPLAKNGLIAGCVLAFARSLGEFGATVVFAGNIAGKTQTLSLAIFSFAERPGGLEQCWRLAFFSVIIAGIALVVSQRMERKKVEA